MDVRIVANPPVSADEIKALFGAAWPGRRCDDIGSVLARSLAYVCAFDAAHLVGFVNLAWDGGAHAFLLDPTVHPDFRRRGLGTRLVTDAASIASSRGLEWLHVDYEPHLEGFYRRCGFRPTAAGLMHLSEMPSPCENPSDSSLAQPRAKP